MINDLKSQVKELKSKGYKVIKTSNPGEYSIKLNNLNSDTSNFGI